MSWYLSLHIINTFSLELNLFRESEYNYSFNLLRAEPIPSPGNTRPYSLMQSPKSMLSIKVVDISSIHINSLEKIATTSDC